MLIVFLNVLLVALLAAGFLWEPDDAQAFLPAIAPFALLYLIWRTLTLHGAAKMEARLRAQAVPPATARIVGTILTDPPQFREQLDPDELVAELRHWVTGQQRLTERLSTSLIKRLQDRQEEACPDCRPLFTALIGGSFVECKFNLARGLATHLFSDPRAVLPIDCSELMDRDGIEKLIGEPHGAPGSLTRHLDLHPASVLLFDGLERAVTDPTALLARLLATLLVHGAIASPADGRRIDASRAVVLMTTDLGGTGGLDGRPIGVRQALGERIPEALWPHIDLLAETDPLDDDTKAILIARQIARIGQEYGVEVTQVQAAAVTAALRHWRTLAREDPRELIQWLEDSCAESLIRARKKGARAVTLGWRNGSMIVERMGNG